MLDVNLDGKESQQPFHGADELTQRTIECFSNLRPYFGERIHIMDQMGHLDLDSRKGKAPGGYNYPLLEIGVPFIFMNSADSLKDVRTMVHEGGHAIHSFLSRDLPLDVHKGTPSEVAELASMSMELMSMDHWDVFLKENESLRMARKEQLEGVLLVFPWIAAIDKFQHWIYTNKEHTDEERDSAWYEIFNQFDPDTASWEGQENYCRFMWQKQLHLYQVPFYYIEYAMAQLGAIAIWKQFKVNREQAIKNYMNALKLGYTRSISEIYEVAGIEFDFSTGYVKELAEFVWEELQDLQ